MTFTIVIMRINETIIMCVCTYWRIAIIANVSVHANGYESRTRFLDSHYQSGVHLHGGFS